MGAPFFRAEPGRPSAPNGVGDERHRPEETRLGRRVKEPWKHFLQEAEDEGRTLPRYVLDEVDEYLRWGRLAYGFARLGGDGCAHERLVAFSCKGRGFGPRGRLRVAPSPGWRVTAARNRRKTMAASAIEREGR